MHGMVQEVTMKRRVFFRTVAAAAGVGTVATAGLASARAQVNPPATPDVADIYQLQAAFHRAKTSQDIALMLSLWHPTGTLKVQGDPKSPYVGTEQLRAFWLNSGSFKNRRFSLVPSFKTRIAVHGNQADLYFECHDVADYEKPTRTIISDTFLAGTLRHVGGTWLFYEMSAGPSTPLSLDRYYA